MEIINSLIDFFGIISLGESSTVIDVIKFVILLYFAIFVFVTVFRGLITMCTFNR